MGTTYKWNLFKTEYYIIIHLRDTVTYDILKLLYFGLVQSVLQYGIIFWGSSSHINKAFTVQKWFCDVWMNFILLQVVNHYLYIYGLLWYIIENGLKNKEVHLHNSCRGEDIYQPYSRLSVGQHSPVFMGTKCLNRINSYTYKQY